VTGCPGPMRRLLVRRPLRFEKKEMVRRLSIQHARIVDPARPGIGALGGVYTQFIEARKGRVAVGLILTGQLGEGH